jgi:hypothetical protein
MVGPEAVSQHTPLAITPLSPSFIRLPPEVAEVDEISVISVVAIIGIDRLSFLHD